MKFSVLAIFALASFGESAESPGCPEKWVALTDTCSLEGGDDCVLLGRPNKYLSWSHQQFMCDVEGGFLPELTQANAKKMELILKSFHLLYGETLLYLGATTITRANDWKWMNSHKSVTEDTSSLTADVNKDCLAMKSGTTELVNIDCEIDSLETQIAYICMRKKASAGDNSVVDISVVDEIVPEAECDEGWEKHKGACYRLDENSKKNWNDAREDCKRQGAELASITDGDENSHVQTMVTNSDSIKAWIGAQKDDNNVWTWTDNSDFGQAAYKNWKSGVGYSTCGLLRGSTGKWEKVSSCSNRFYYVCKKSLN